MGANWRVNGAWVPQVDTSRPDSRQRVLLGLLGLLGLGYSTDRVRRIQTRVEERERERESRLENTSRKTTE